ncbi:electron transport complex subunit RsxC [Candidatus Poribacteria bacterium]|nr:electron transport complex subunit RsxC [Candidatus Poribacteria bacterium]
MKTFRGGVHPDCKKESADIKIEKADLPPKLIIPLQQHIGAPAQPLVEVGDEVKKGQKIAEAGGFVSANIHASTSGKVIDISEYLYPNTMGRKALSAIIESDGKDEQDEQIKPYEAKLFDSDDLVDHIEGQEILDLIREAGVVGMGGATFPTDVKLNIPPGKEIDSIILNGVECEPYVTPDHRLMVEKPEKVVDGLRFMMKAINVNRGFIGIEMNKPDAIESIRKATGKYSNIKVFPLKVKYPQGWENILIKVILDREVPPGSLPLDVGVVVANVGTSAAVSDAVRHGYPLIERVVSVTGSGIAEPRNLLVKIGTPFLHIIEQCGGFKGTVKKVIAGGPMMGFTMFDVNIPVIKGTTNILALTDQEVKEHEPKPCIRCGRCVNVCPVRLVPRMIALLAKQDEFEKAEEYNPLDCKECGCCAYICPAKIPLVQLIQHAKADIMARQRAAKAK